MTDHDDVAQRAYYQPDPGSIEIREDDNSDDGLFRLRMPISSTLEARDGDAFDRDRLDGWATQINDGVVPVYGDHGANLDLAGSRYSAFGKLGYYDDAEVNEIADRDGEYELVADTVVMDPDSLPEETGSLRENLARVKAQADRGIPITQSVGWNDDVGNRDVPGDSDLLEGSIVGIPSDNHASSHNSGGVPAAARAAVAAGADPEALVDEFRTVVMESDDADPDRRHVSEKQADIALELLDSYRSEQGNGSVENFEDWLWSAGYHQFDENEFHAARTALQEFFRDHAPLDEPVDERLTPYLDEKRDDGGDGDGGEDEDGDSDRDDMTDGTDSPDGESGDGTREEDGISAEEFREQMLEMQRSQTETLNTLTEVVRDDDSDDEDEEDEDDDGDDEDDDGDRTVTIDGEEVDARDAVEQLRADLGDAEPETPDDERGEDAGERDEEADEQRDSDPRNLLK